MNVYSQDKDTSSTQQCVYDAYNSFLSTPTEMSSSKC